MSILNSSVVAYVLSRSRWTGFKLIITLAWVLFGVTTLMSQIETFVFIRTLPPGFLPRLVLAGAVFSAIFSALAVILFGKLRSKDTEVKTHWWTQLSAREWIVRLAIIAVAYVILYFTFGYYIACEQLAAGRFPRSTSDPRTPRRHRSAATVYATSPRAPTA